MAMLTRSEQIRKLHAAADTKSNEEVAARRAAESAGRADARSISVADVLQRADFVGKRDGSRIEYRQAGRDSNIKTHGQQWSDNLECVNGFGGFSLAQHLQIDAGTLPRRTYIPQAPSEPEAKPPAEVASNWEHVRQWLTAPLPGRNIPADVIDAARAAGLLYSDSQRRAIFVRQSGGVFSRSTKPNDTSKYSKLTFGKGGSPFVLAGDDRLFIAESAINALSLLARNPGATCIGTGGDGSPGKLTALIERASAVYLCFDNDHAGNGFAGDRMAAKIREAFPQFIGKLKDHKPPMEFKDWNDVLTNKRKPEAT